MRIIGLNGKKKRGKDTVFGILKEEYPELDIRRDAFADRLKISFARLFLEPGTQDEDPYEGWTDADMIAFTDHFKENGAIMVPEFLGGPMPDTHDIYSWNVGPVSGREALQKYGTEMHRDVFGKDFWVDQVLPPIKTTYAGYEHANDSLIKRVTHGADVFVITDVRFPNEAERVKAYGGEIWEVIRPELDEADTDGHASEVPLPRELVDHVIVNDGTLDDLRTTVYETFMNTKEPQYG